MSDGTNESIKAVAAAALRCGPGSYGAALEAMLKVLEDSAPSIKAQGGFWRARQLERVEASPIPEVPSPVPAPVGFGTGTGWVSLAVAAAVISFVLWRLL